MNSFLRTFDFKPVSILYLFNGKSANKSNDVLQRSQTIKTEQNSVLIENFNWEGKFNPGYHLGFTI